MAKFGIKIPNMHDNLLKKNNGSYFVVNKGQF